MRTLVQIQDYVAQLKQDQRNIPEVTTVSIDILTLVTTPQQFVMEMQSRGNLTNHDDPTHLQELKRLYNIIIDYANEDDSMAKTNWETQEVVNWLTNDEAIWNELRGQTANEIKDWVKRENGPNGLYQSFRQPPASSFDDVDWEEVAESLEN